MGVLIFMVSDCITVFCFVYKFTEKFFIYIFVMGVRVNFNFFCVRLFYSFNIFIMVNTLSELFAEEIYFKFMFCIVGVGFYSMLVVV